MSLYEYLDINQILQLEGYGDMEETDSSGTTRRTHHRTDSPGDMDTTNWANWANWTDDNPDDKPIPDGGLPETPDSLERQDSPTRSDSSPERQDSPQRSDSLKTESPFYTPPDSPLYSPIVSPFDSPMGSPPPNESRRPGS